MSSRVNAQATAAEKPIQSHWPSLASETHRIYNAITSPVVITIQDTKQLYMQLKYSKDINYCKAVYSHSHMCWTTYQYKIRLVQHVSMSLCARLQASTSSGYDF